VLLGCACRHTSYLDNDLLRGLGVASKSSFRLSHLFASLLARRSLVTISIIERKSSLGVNLSLIPCVCLPVRKVYCGKTADWIRMPFGVVSGVGRGMVIVEWEGGDLGVNLGRPIVTNGDFVAYCESDAVFTNYFVEDLFN